LYFKSGNLGNWALLGNPIRLQYSELAERLVDLTIRSLLMEAITSKLPLLELLVRAKTALKNPKLREIAVQASSQNAACKTALALGHTREEALSVHSLVQAIRDYPNHWESKAAELGM
jgi:hypothetical protein